MQTQAPVSGMSFVRPEAHRPFRAGPCCPGSPALGSTFLAQIPWPRSRPERWLPRGHAAWTRPRTPRGSCSLSGRHGVTLFPWVVTVCPRHTPTCGAEPGNTDITPSALMLPGRPCPSPPTLGGSPWTRSSRRQRQVAPQNPSPRPSGGQSPSQGRGCLENCQGCPGTGPVCYAAWLGHADWCTALELGE